MERNLRISVVYFLYLFSTWSFFRYFFRLPELVDELWFKPVIFLVPLFFIYLGRGDRPKFWEGNVFKGLVVGLLAGIALKSIFMIVSKQALELSLEKIMTTMLISTVEQMTFAGLVLPLVNRGLRNETGSSLLVAVMYGLVHIPLLWFGKGVWMNVVVGAFLINFCISFVANKSYLNTKNLVCPILIESLVLL